MIAVVEKIFRNSSYMEDLVVRMAFHSASIEGNTITIDETRSILVDDIIPNFRRRVSLREIHELSNLQTSLDYILSITGERITISVMHKLHQLVMNNIDPDAGKFKTTQNMVGGELTTPPERTPLEINYLIDQLYNGWLAYSTTFEDKVKAAVSFHLNYEKIHPYADGNGRTGRLLLNQILLAENIAPFVIKVEDKAFYYQCLRENDAQSLTDYALKCIGVESVCLGIQE